MSQQEMATVSKKSHFRAREVGAAIKRLRKRARMSQGEVSEKTGISVQTISNIEVGRVMPELDSLCAIAEGIGVEPAMLVRHGVSEGSGQQMSDRAEAIDILSELNPSLTKLALEQLRALRLWEQEIHSKSKVKT